MSALDPATDAALGGLAVLAAIALKIELPSATIRLLDGAGTVGIGGELYRGADDVFGTISAMESVSDGTDNEAPSLQIVLLPPTNAGMAILADPAVQGSPVLQQLVVIDPITGLIIGEPIPLFTGELDQPVNKPGQQTKALQFTCTSSFDRFLVGDEGARLNNAFHQTLYPGELGLEFVSAVTVRNPWGSDAPRTTLTPNNQTY